MPDAPTQTPADARPWVRRWAPLALCVGVFAIDVFLNLRERGDFAAGVVHVVPLLISLWVRADRSRVPIYWLAQALNFALLPILGWKYGSGPWRLHEGFGLSAHEIVDRVLIAFVLWITRELALRRLSIEQRLYAEREFTRTTLQSIDDAVISTDARGRVRFANPRASELLGRRADELVGRPLSELLALRERAGADPLGGELPGERDERASTQWLQRPGLPDLPVDHSRAPLRDAAGDLCGEVLVLRDASERERHTDAMRELAYRDELTGLSNRVTLHDRLQLELEHARRHQTRLGVLYIDLDGFKRVNDEHGHRAGDAVLCSVANGLRVALRRGDTIARLGGDEFALLLPRLAGDDDVRAVARKVLEAIRAPVEFEGAVLRVSASLGLALHPEHGADGAQLLRVADAAMYRAKQRGSALCVHGGAPESLLADAHESPDAREVPT
ncbi:MAG: sensor domain-containing diguanylate cyclase [Planctomycetota bacterium]|nr:MAG: sensor domain-containing diguanylate cyclase [Planctomycetota bacterium]